MMAILSNVLADPDSLGDAAGHSQHAYPCGHKYCGTCKARAEREWLDQQRLARLGDAAGAFGLLAAVVTGCWIGGAFGLWGL